MSKPDSPTPPDFLGAANSMGRSSVVNTILQSMLGHTNQVTPLGSQTWNQTGSFNISPTSGVFNPPANPNDAPAFGGAHLGSGSTGTVPPPSSAPIPLNAASSTPASGISLPGLPTPPGLPTLPGLPGTGGNLIPGLPGGPPVVPNPNPGGTPSSPIDTSPPPPPPDPNAPPADSLTIPTFTSTTELTPEGQHLFETNLGTQQSEANAANAIAGQIPTAGFDPSTLPPGVTSDQLAANRTSVENALYGRATQYLDPQFNQAEEAERNRLAGQGFQVGNEGYDRAMSNFNLSKQKAYSDARDAAVAQGGTEQSRLFSMSEQARNQAIQEALLQQNQPINMLNALQSGSQVSMPSFSPSGTAGMAQAPDTLGAAAQQGQFNQGLFNAATGTYNSQLGGLMGLGSAALMASLLGSAAA